jgi:hypothetical protein
MEFQNLQQILLADLNKKIEGRETGQDSGSGQIRPSGTAVAWESPGFESRGGPSDRERWAMGACGCSI